MARWALASTFRLIAILLVVACTGTQEPSPAPPSEPPSRLTDALNAYMQAQAREYGFRGAVLVARGDVRLLRAGFGYADAGSREPVTADMRFPIASVTKALVATAVGWLADEGIVGFHDPVCEHLNPCPRSWSGINASNLLNHTSGIPQLPPGQIRGATLRLAVERVMDLPLQFRPGSDYSYSNANYWLLGSLIEQTADLPWAEYLQRSIFDPAGMSATGLDSEIEPDASGFTLALDADGSPTPVTNRLTYEAGHATLLDDPAGGLVSTVDDLYAFLRALDTGRLLSPQVRHRMWTPIGAGRFADYGFGWETFDQNGTRVLQHGGAMPGFGACASLYPDEDVYVVVLSNLPEAIACEYIGRELGAIVLGRRYVMPRAPDGVDVPVATLRRYVGAYEPLDALGGERIDIRLSNGTLVMKGLASVPRPFVQVAILEPFTRTHFFNPQDPHVTISFEHDEPEASILFVHRPPYKRLPAMTERFVEVTR